jgi:hypothetical protein
MSFFKNISEQEVRTGPVWGVCISVIRGHVGKGCRRVNTVEILKRDLLK